MAAAKQSKDETAPVVDGTDVGYLGVRVDPTPLENYTFSGQAAGKPTPETDQAAADAARGRHAEVTEQITT